NEGMSLGQKVVFTETTQISAGNVTIVSKIPEGTPIFNIESRPNDGGRFVRTGGTAAEIVTHTETKTIIRMPSGKFRELPRHPAGRQGRQDRPQAHGHEEVSTMAKRVIVNPGAARRKMRKAKAVIETRSKKEFTYRGKSLEELQALPIGELLPLLPSRTRR